ncbi:MAG: hypothetical protein O2782_15860 [bacterium]|nr:hypothetical protein [bacterium]
MPATLDKIIPFVGNGMWAELDAGSGTRIAFHQAFSAEGPDHSPTGSPDNPHKLVFAVPSVKRARQELIEAGVTMYEIAGEGEVVYCDGEDVESHRFQLIGPV